MSAAEPKLPKGHAERIMRKVMRAFSKVVEGRPLKLLIYMTVRAELKKNTLVGKIHLQSI